MNPLQSCFILIHGGSGGTATYQITPPEKFNFKEPDSWPKRFSQASGLTEKSSESQVNALIYSMGEEADDILFSFDEQSKNFETIKKQQAVVRHEELTSESVERIASRKPPGTSRSDQAHQTICTRCGKSPTHPRFRCPANTAECHRCHKIGHYQKFCKTKLDIN